MEYQQAFTAGEERLCICCMATVTASTAKKTAVLDGAMDLFCGWVPSFLPPVLPLALPIASPPALSSLSHPPHTPPSPPPPGALLICPSTCPAYSYLVLACERISMISICMTASFDPGCHWQAGHFNAANKRIPNLLVVVEELPLVCVGQVQGSTPVLVPYLLTWEHLKSRQVLSLCLPGLLQILVVQLSLHVTLGSF